MNREPRDSTRTMILGLCKAKPSRWQKQLGYSPHTKSQPQNTHKACIGSIEPETES